MPHYGWCVQAVPYDIDRSRQVTKDGFSPTFHVRPEFQFFTLMTSNVRQLTLDSASYRREKPCGEDLPPWKAVPDVR